MTILCEAIEALPEIDGARGHEDLHRRWEAQHDTASTTTTRRRCSSSKTAGTWTTPGPTVTSSVADDADSTADEDSDAEDVEHKPLTTAGTSDTLSPSSLVAAACVAERDRSRRSRSGCKP